MAFSNAHPGAGEVEITECLRTGMRKALAETSADWGKRMTVLRGTESRSSSALGAPDGLTDIPIFFHQIREERDEHEVHAIIECKRVAESDARLCRKYVVEGIDRFKTGKYAGNHAAGFMAGYLLSGNAHEATVGINKYLSGRGRPDQLGPSTISDAPWARSSRHSRPKPAEPIDLHHAFLSF